MHAQAACRVTFCLASSALSDRTNALCAMQSGPAYNSRALGLGDAILKVDGQPATPENFQRILVGNDKPGSIVTLTIVKGESAANSHGRPTSSHNPGQLVAVKLQRMSRAELVDKVLWINDIISAHMRPLRHLHSNHVHIASFDAHNILYMTSRKHVAHTGMMQLMRL